MDKLSKEELLKILATSEKPRKQRKAQVLDEEKQIAMLERLASMRETVKKNREAKKTNAHEEIKEIDDVFEKKYGSKFDKMNELLTDLNENTKEQLKLKREKANKKAEIKTEEIKKSEDKPEVKLQIRESVATPQTMTSIPKPVASVVNKPFPNPTQNPCRPSFPKSNTRF